MGTKCTNRRSERRRGVVVVDLQRAAVGRARLESVRGHETVVVDHGSTDGTRRARARALPRGARSSSRRTVGLRRRQQPRHARDAAAATSCCSTPTPGSSATRSSGSPRSRTRIRDAAVVGPRLRNPDGTLQRSVRGFPTLWRLATEYLFLRKLAPRSRALERLLRGGLRPRRGARGGLRSMAPCLLVRRDGDRRGRPPRRGLLPLQRGDRLVLPLPRRPAGRCSSSPAPRSCTSAARRTAAGSSARTSAATCASSRSTAGRAQAERARRLLALALRLRGAARSAASAARRYRDAARWLASGDVRGRCSTR